MAESLPPAAVQHTLYLKASAPLAGEAGKPCSADLAWQADIVQWQGGRRLLAAQTRITTVQVLSYLTVAAELVGAVSASRVGDATGNQAGQHGWFKHLGGIIHLLKVQLR